MTFFGRLFLIFLAAGAVIGVNLLVGSYSYDRFFIMAGIELIVVAVVGWIIYLIRIRPSRRTTR